MHIKVTQEIRNSRSGGLGIIILLLFLILGCLSPLMMKQATTQTGEILQKPSLDHIFGTNDVGQDVFARLVLGTKTSLMVTLGVMVLGMILAVGIGVSAGFIGGWYENLVMRIIDAFLVLPGFIVLLLLSAYFRPGLWTLIFFIALLRWPMGARIIRAQTKSLKEKLHVQASQSFGAGRGYVFFRHILPDLGPILVVLTVQFARTAVFMEAGLAFMGIADPRMISWGTILHHAFKFYYLEVWWWLFPAGILLSLFILALTLLGYSLEKIIEPRLKNG